MQACAKRPGLPAFPPISYDGTGRAAPLLARHVRTSHSSSARRLAQFDGPAQNGRQAHALPTQVMSLLHWNS
jgi:hypothetical protein